MTIYMQCDILYAYKMKGVIIVTKTSTMNISKEQNFNKETLEAIAEVDEMIKNSKKYKSYNDVYEMIEDIKNEE